MENLFLVVFLIIGILAIPYFYQILSLKKISIDDIPESGSWVKYQGEIYITNGFFLQISWNLKEQWYWFMVFPHQALFGGVL